VTTMLDTIVARKRERGVRESGLPERRETPPRPFLRDDFTIIAEVKKASPSRGTFDPPRDPVALARAYAAGGADAISVLTERDHFRGSIDDLRAVRAAGDRPVLRKDFLTTTGEIDDADRAGADAVLLIVAILEDAALREMIEHAAGLGLTALVEVHDESEIDRALVAGARSIGINNRDLRTFRVDTGHAARLRPRIPEDRAVVAESGYATADDVRALVAARDEAMTRRRQGAERSAG